MTVPAGGEPETKNTRRQSRNSIHRLTTGDRAHWPTAARDAASLTLDIEHEINDKRVGANGIVERLRNTKSTDRA
jgi:hypothetical protein